MIELRSATVADLERWSGLLPLANGFPAQIGEFRVGSSPATLLIHGDDEHRMFASVYTAHTEWDMQLDSPEKLFGLVAMCHLDERYRAVPETLREIGFIAHEI